MKDMEHKMKKKIVTKIDMSIERIENEVVV